LLVLGLGVRVAYVLATAGHGLAGDELSYDAQGRLMADGMVLWGTDPFGEAHPTIWKMPLYPLWVGGLYTVLGPDPDRVLLVQTLLGPATIALTWALGRRLFTPLVGLGAAAVVAVYPNAWQYEARLYSEALAVPLAILLAIVVLDRTPTPKRALLAGAVLAANVYVRPSAILLIAGVLVAFWAAAGLRRGSVLAVAAGLVVVVALVPWQARTYHLEGEFVPLSTQDAALYGTFNDEAADDPFFRWKWRPVTERDLPLFRGPDRAQTESELRRRLRENALDYIAANPSSVPRAFWANGIRRTFDLRRPSTALFDVPFEGRTRSVAGVGLLMYWVLAPLALLGLWRARSRRALVLPLLALALATAVVYTADGGTRYRAPLEPLIVVMACSLLAPRPRPAADPAHG
jgi:4-amino-4-deoxy-L-arabinose transferase-like glycosyltransferase